MEVTLKHYEERYTLTLSSSQTYESSTEGKPEVAVGRKHWSKILPLPWGITIKPTQNSLSLITTSSSDILNITIYSLPHFKKKKKKCSCCYFLLNNWKILLLPPFHLNYDTLPSCKPPLTVIMSIATSIQPLVQKEEANMAGTLRSKVRSNYPCI